MRAGVSAAAGAAAIGPRAKCIALWQAATARPRGARAPPHAPVRGRGGVQRAAAAARPPLRTFCSAFTACTRTACTRAGRLALLRCTPLRRPQGLVTSAVCMMLLLLDLQAAWRRRLPPLAGHHQAHPVDVAPAPLNAPAPVIGPPPLFGAHPEHRPALRATHPWGACKPLFPAVSG